MIAIAEGTAAEPCVEENYGVARERSVGLPVSIALRLVAESFRKSSILSAALSLGLFGKFPPERQTATQAAARSLSWLTARLLLNALGAHALCLFEGATVFRRIFDSC